MTRTTQQLRDLWSPACTGPWAQITLNGGAKFGVRPAIVEAVKALDAIFKKYGYRATAPDCGCYNCRPITGSRPEEKRYSLHAYSIALDINWNDNGYGPRLVTDMPIAMIVEIEALRTGNGAVVWRWGGRYTGNKDAMHFEIVASPAEIATGIRGRAASVDAVKAVYKRGDSGAAVKLWKGLLSLAWQYRITKAGHVGGGQLNTSDQFDGQTEEATREFQRYINRDLFLQGKKSGIDEDGIAGPVTQFLMAGVIDKIK